MEGHTSHSLATSVSNIHLEHLPVLPSHLTSPTPNHRAISASSPSRPRTPIRNRFRRAYKCSNCNGRHSVKWCPLLIPPPPQCTRCGQEGHKIEICPDKIKEMRESLKTSGLLLPRLTGQAITTKEKEMAIRVYYNLKAETAVGFVSTQNAVRRTCAYTGISKVSLAAIQFEWEANREFADVKSRRGQYARRMHWTRNWMSEIRSI